MEDEDAYEGGLAAMDEAEAIAETEAAAIAAADEALALELSRKRWNDEPDEDEEREAEEDFTQVVSKAQKKLARKKQRQFSPVKGTSGPPGSPNKGGTPGGGQGGGGSTPGSSGGGSGTGTGGSSGCSSSSSPPGGDGKGAHVAGTPGSGKPSGGNSGSRGPGSKRFEGQLVLEITIPAANIKGDITPIVGITCGVLELIAAADPTAVVTTKDNMTVPVGALPSLVQDQSTFSPRFHDSVTLLPAEQKARVTISAGLSSDLRSEQLKKHPGMLEFLTNNSVWLKTTKSVYTVMHKIGFEAMLDPRAVYLYSLNKNIGNLVAEYITPDELAAIQAHADRQKAEVKIDRKFIAKNCVEIRLGNMYLGSGDDRAKVRAFEVFAPYAHRQIIKEALCRAMEKPRDSSLGKFVPLGIARNTYVKVVECQEAYLRAAWRITLEGLNPQAPVRVQHEPVAVEQTVDAYITGLDGVQSLEPTNDSGTKGRYIIITTKAHRFSVNQAIDALLEGTYRSESDRPYRPAAQTRVGDQPTSLKRLCQQWSETDAPDIGPRRVRPPRPQHVSLAALTDPEKPFQLPTWRSTPQHGNAWSTGRLLQQARNSAPGGIGDRSSFGTQVGPPGQPPGGQADPATNQATAATPATPVPPPQVSPASPAEDIKSMFAEFRAEIRAGFADLRSEFNGKLAALDQPAQPTPPQVPAASLVVSPEADNQFLRQQVASLTQQNQQLLARLDQMGAQLQQQTQQIQQLLAQQQQDTPPRYSSAYSQQVANINGPNGQFHYNHHGTTPPHQLHNGQVTTPAPPTPIQGTPQTGIHHPGAISSPMVHSPPNTGRVLDNHDLTRQIHPESVGHSNGGSQ
jgi:hypothetical protein